MSAPPMTQAAMAELMERVFQNEINHLREAGQSEYAHDEDNAFANFDRLADDLDLDRKMILWVYAMKHRDGIASWLQGHKSQREDVRGRINDLIVYLFLLRGMIEAESDMGWIMEVDRPTGVEQAARIMKKGEVRATQFAKGLFPSAVDKAPYDADQLPTPKQVGERVSKQAEEAGLSSSPVS